MAVFRIEKTRDYTVMSNHHLRNTQLSLKAKGLLSLMLSLPDGWDYTTRGLAHICKDGVDMLIFDACASEIFFGNLRHWSPFTISVNLTLINPGVFTPGL